MMMISSTYASTAMSHLTVGALESSVMHAHRAVEVVADRARLNVKQALALLGLGHVLRLFYQNLRIVQGR